MPRGGGIRYMGRMQTSGGYCLLCFGGRSGNVLIIRFFSQTGSVCSKWYEERWREKKEKNKKKPLFYLINPSFPSLHSHCWRLQGQQHDWLKRGEKWWGLVNWFVVGSAQNSRDAKSKQKKKAVKFESSFVQISAHCWFLLLVNQNKWGFTWTTFYLNCFFYGRKIYCIT